MDTNGVTAFLSKDVYIGPLVEKFGPIELVPQKKSHYFVSLVSAITSQQLSIKAADTIFGRLEGRLGKMTPKNILATKDEELRECGLSFAKIRYIKDLSARIMNKELRIKELAKLRDEEVARELIAVKGIGRWTAEMFLMFTLGRPDIFPVDDLGIRNGFRKLTGKDLLPDEMAKFAERWKPYRTYASRYIWEILDNKK